MKWADAYILYLPIGDPASYEAARHYKARYHVPDHKCFSYEAIPGFLPINDGCLRDSTIHSKIIILAHGGRRGVRVGYQAYEGGVFALFLRNALGLRYAGVLSFKTCFLGAGEFLGHFSWFMGGMLIGYLVAPSDISYTVCAGDDGVYVAVGDADYILRTSTGGRSKFQDILRVRVVRGNFPVIPPYGNSYRFMQLMGPFI